MSVTSLVPYVENPRRAVPALAESKIEGSISCFIENHTRGTWGWVRKDGFR